MAERMFLATVIFRNGNTFGTDVKSCVVGASSEAEAIGLALTHGKRTVPSGSTVLNGPSVWDITDEVMEWVQRNTTPPQARDGREGEG